MDGATSKRLKLEEPPINFNKDVDFLVFEDACSSDFSFATEITALYQSTSQEQLTQIKKALMSEDKNAESLLVLLFDLRSTSSLLGLNKIEQRCDTLINLSKLGVKKSVETFLPFLEEEITKVTRSLYLYIEHFLKTKTKI